MNEWVNQRNLTMRVKVCNLYLLEEGKSVFSDGLVLGISNLPGQASCSGIVDQHIMVFLFVILFVYSFVSFVLLSFGIVLFYFLGFIVVWDFCFF